MTNRSVIFDFNGTLYWDTAYHNQAWDIFLKNHDLSLSDDEKNNKIHGKSNEDILKNLFINKLEPEEIEQLSIEKEKIYQEIALKEGLEYAPGVLGFIDFLRQNKINYTIATSSAWINIEFYIKYMHLDKWFDIDKIVYDNGSFRSKPNGDIFILAMEKIDAEPEEVIVFEDSPTGIMAAENAGAGTIIAVNSVGRNLSHLPYTVISHFNEVDREMFLS